MTQEAVRALSDMELPQLINWAEQEIRAREEKRRQETIAKIKQLAGAAGVTVAIGGIRGRPAKPKAKTPIRKKP